MQLSHPLSLFSLRMRSMIVLCHLRSPWHMFRRATFMPPAARVASISKESVLGPIVQMILVRRVLRKPAAMKVQDMMLLIIGSGLDCCMLCRI